MFAWADATHCDGLSDRQIFGDCGPASSHWGTLAGVWHDQKPRRDKDGKRWNFSIWYDVWTDGKLWSADRLFFWDDDKTFCGVVLFPRGSSVHFSRLNQLVEK